MNISARADYAVRAMAELAASNPERLMKSETLAGLQGIPRLFLHNILRQLRSSGLVRTVRGPDGGTGLARPANEITIAEVLRAVDGPLADVCGMRPEEVVGGSGPSSVMPLVWVALRANMRAVLESVTLADLVSGQLPDEIAALAASPQARRSR